MHRRRGYSLFEVMVVTGVVLVIGFLSLPLLKPMLESNHLQSSSDLVQSRWTEMRFRAMAEGRPYRFAFKERSGKFRIAPDDGDFWGEGGNAPQSDTPPWIVEENLPGQVQFKSATASALGNAPAAQTSQGGGDWTRAVVFLPDGTSREDVRLTFGQEGSRGVTLNLRGTTGSVTSSDAGEGNSS